MKFKLLDTVALDRDLPEHGLRCGDLGAVVEVHAPDGLDVEFANASGKTEALVTLSVNDLLAVAEGDLIAGRPIDTSRRRSARSDPLPGDHQRALGVDDLDGHEHLSTRRRGSSPPR